MKIGVLSLQGDFAAHAKTVTRSGHEPVAVKKPEHLRHISGLILPGGESTTHLRLLEQSGIKAELISFYRQGRPIFGTCAGAILMARKVVPEGQFCFGFLAIEIKRNAYGSQKDSFGEKIWIPSLADYIPGVFIRAPRIIKVADEAEILATFQDFPILVRQDHCLAATFHPELTENTGIHNIFFQMCKE